MFFPPGENRLETNRNSYHHAFIYLLFDIIFFSLHEKAVCMVIQIAQWFFFAILRIKTIPRQFTSNILRQMLELPRNNKNRKMSRSLEENQEWMTTSFIPHYWYFLKNRFLLISLNALHTWIALSSYFLLLLCHAVIVTPYEFYDCLHTCEKSRIFFLLYRDITYVCALMSHKNKKQNWFILSFLLNI